MKIRNATGQDIARITILVNKFVHEVPAWGLVARKGDDLKNLDKQLIWVVEDKNKLIGYAICLPRANDGSCIYSESDKILELDEMYLIPEARRKGIGSELLNVIQTHAVKAGFTKFLMYSAVKNLDPVIDFYRENGFKTWGIQMFKDID
jgi:ribosomal protein S18 acetylase RimI-like enzyme